MDEIKNMLTSLFKYIIFKIKPEHFDHRKDSMKNLHRRMYLYFTHRYKKIKIENQ